MIDAPLALGFAAGMVAAFNPCGFAMLPAYVSWFLGLETTGGAQPAQAGVFRSLAVGACVSAGFLVVFGVAGLLITQFSLAFGAFTPWVTVVVGFVLIPLGVAQLLGGKVKLALPGWQRSVQGRGLLAMILFGASYAMVSLSCTLLPFLVAVSGTFQEQDLLSGLAVFGAYSAGMGVVLMSLTLALGLARASLVRGLRRALPYVERLSGSLLVVAGAYIVYYGYYSMGINDGRDVAAGPVAFVERISGAVTTFLADSGETTIGVILAGIVVLAAAVALLIRRRAGVIATVVHTRDGEGESAKPPRGANGSGKDRWQTSGASGRSELCGCASDEAQSPAQTKGEIT